MGYLPKLSDEQLLTFVINHGFPKAQIRTDKERRDMDPEEEFYFVSEGEEYLLWYSDFCMFLKKVIKLSGESAGTALKDWIIGEMTREDWQYYMYEIYGDLYIDAYKELNGNVRRFVEPTFIQNIPFSDLETFIKSFCQESDAMLLPIVEVKTIFKDERRFKANISCGYRSEFILTDFDIKIFDKFTIRGFNANLKLNWLECLSHTFGNSYIKAYRLHERENLTKAISRLKFFIK